MPISRSLRTSEDGSVGFSDETLKKYGWVDAKEFWRWVARVFRNALSEQRKVLEAENGRSAGVWI